MFISSYFLPCAGNAVECRTFTNALLTMTRLYFRMLACRLASCLSLLEGHVTLGGPIIAYEI